MRVVHLNLSDGGIGASIAAFRLHHALRRQGHDSKMLVWQKASEDLSIQRLEGSRLWRFLNRITILLLDGLGLQYLFAPSAARVLRHPWIREADIVHLHIMHGGYFSLSVLPWLSRQIPVVLTLHDMWPMTGHCAVAAYNECPKWQTGCGHCPQLGDYPALRRDTSALLWRIRRAIYNRSSLTLICPSSWMASQVRASPLMQRFPTHVIPNGVDLQLFRPMNRTAAREVLGLSTEAPILMFSADSLSKPRKGGRDLTTVLQSISQMTDAKPVLLLVGRGVLPLEMDDTLSQFEIRLIGSVNNDLMMRICYSAADLVLLPTWADNLPSVLIEGIACGTPCVSYSVGGVGEIIDHLETGYLARYRDVNDLAEGVVMLLKNKDLRSRLSQRAVVEAARRFSINLQVTRCLDAYTEALLPHVAKGHKRDSKDT